MQRYKIECKHKMKQPQHKMPLFGFTGCITAANLGPVESRYAVCGALYVAGHGLVQPSAFQARIKESQSAQGSDRS